MSITKQIEDFINKFQSAKTFLPNIQERPAYPAIQVEDSRNGEPTLEYHSRALHSKYNPISEAERFLASFGDIKQKHVLFVGMGLGYHIDLFVSQYPNTSFSVYEPSAEIFHTSIWSREWRFLEQGRFENLYIGIDAEYIRLFLNQVMKFMYHEILIITLPSYLRIFPSEYATFETIFRDVVDLQHNNTAVSLAFEKRWIINSMMNISTTATTPNILQDYYRNKLTEKPAMIVAAGPSLNDEIGHLRHVKENGLAYIFSVGSAINTLLEHNIEPDAICAYDPTELQYVVYNKVLEKGMEHIPFLYGSSVGFETVQKYTNPKLNVIVNKDTIAPFFLKRLDGKELSMVSDAPSIAVVTLQVLALLGCNPIILVGQNLAYRNDLKYSTGIEYDTQIVSTDELEKAVTVEDVHGNITKTTSSFNRMRESIEKVIQLFNLREVINTTKGGAKINGTTYMPLENLLTTHLQENVVERTWYQINEASDYDKIFMTEQANKMEQEFEKVEGNLMEINSILRRMKTTVDRRELHKINNITNKLEVSLQRLADNIFFRLVLYPLNYVLFDRFLRLINESKYENNLIVKANTLYDEVNRFLLKTKADLLSILPFYQHMIGELKKTVNQEGAITE